MDARAAIMTSAYLRRLRACFLSNASLLCIHQILHAVHRHSMNQFTGLLWYVVHGQWRRTVQAAAVAALGLGPCGGQPVKDMAKSFAERRDYMMSRLAAIRGLTVVEPQGAFYVFPDVSPYIGEDVSAKDFGPIPDVDTLCRYLLEVAKVALVPGDAFGVPTCIRLSYAASMETLKCALDRIENALGPTRVSSPYL
jgi:hypothetical protein